MKRQRAKITRRILMLALIVISFVFIFIFYYPHRHIKDDVITRNLTNSTLFLPKMFSEERTLAWDSELPYWIKNDLNLAKKKKYPIEYQFGSSTINIHFDDETPYLSASSPYSWFLSISFSENSLSNFSVYYDKSEKALKVFGYSKSSPEQFESYTLYSDYTKIPEQDTISYDTNLPLNLDIYASIDAVQCGDYSLYFDKETSTFLFYKDGKVVSSRTFQDSIDKLYIYDGIITTTNNLLYKIYVYEKDGVPDIKFVFVSEDASVIREAPFAALCKNLSSKDTSLTIVQKHEEFYVLYPEDIETYKVYDAIGYDLPKYKSGLNFNINLVKLRNQFSYAEFSNDSKYWNVTLNFNINGELYSTAFRINGYDSIVSLNEDEINKLSIRVDSLDEIWNHIEKIREAYGTYYEHSFDDLLKGK